MKLEDLKAHVSNFRGNRTSRNINVYVSDEIFGELINQIRKENNYSISWYMGSFYFNKDNFTIHDNGGIKYKIENNHCQINSDIGGDYSEVLTEEERLIKKVLE